MKRSPRISWLQFRLATLFLLMAVTAILLAVRFSWQPAWIRGRRPLLEGLKAQQQLVDTIHWDGISSTDTISCHFGEEPFWADYPTWLLWFYGEPGIDSIQLIYIVDDAARMHEDHTDDVAAAEKMFPEAYVSTCTYRRVASAVDAVP